MHASEYVHFQRHNYLGKIDNNDESNSFYASVLRDTNCAPRNSLHSTPNIDISCESNLSKNELRFADGHLGEKTVLHDKIIGKLICKKDAWTRRMMGLQNWSN